MTATVDTGAVESGTVTGTVTASTCPAANDRGGSAAESRPLLNIIRPAAANAATPAANAACAIRDGCRGRDGVVVTEPAIAALDITGSNGADTGNPWNATIAGPSTIAERVDIMPSFDDTPAHCPHTCRWLCGISPEPKPARISTHASDRTSST